MQAFEVFKALGEPTRLKMVERLSVYGSQSITSLSTGLQMSRQGARKHLQILVDAEIVVLTEFGRDTQAKIDQRALEVSKKFIEKIEMKWESRLRSLKKVVEE